MLSTSGTQRVTGLNWVSGSLTRTTPRRPQGNHKGAQKRLQVAAKAVQFTLQTPAGKSTVQKDFFSIGTGGGSDLLLDGQKGCSYLLAPGAKLAFGDQAQHYVLDFDEKSGPDPLGDMLMKGMLSQASPEVRKQMEQGS